MIWFIWYLQKKKAEEKNKRQGLGRKGKKDHLWLIIKEYLHLNNIHGQRIHSAYAFERPEKEDLHEEIKKCEIFKAKALAKKNKQKYIKQKYPDRFPIEDYFDALEKETAELNKQYISELKHEFKSHRRELIEKNKRGFNKRRRYVIIYRLENPNNKELSNWYALEAEIFSNYDAKSKLKDRVVINKEVDYEKELSWLLTQKLEREKPKKKR